MAQILKPFIINCSHCCTDKGIWIYKR